MKNKDVLLLENLYQEGIIDRLKGQGAGIKTGAGTILKNIGSGLTGDKTPKQSAGKEYAKAQQTSLLQSFKNKVNKEIQDFNNDLKSFKVNPDPVQLEKDFPIIAQRLKEIDKLKSFLDNPSASTTTPTSKTEPDFEVLPPEGSDKQQSLPSTSEKLALPSTSEKLALPAPEEKNASKSNEEFLAARGEQAPTQEEPTQEEPTQEEPTQEEPTQEEPTQEEPTQPLKPIQPFKYTNGKTYGRDEQGWYQYFPKSKFKKQRVSQKLAEVLDAYLKEEEPTGSAKQAQRATAAGFRSPVEKTAATTIGDSYNPFADFLKGYELI